MSAQSPPFTPLQPRPSSSPSSTTTPPSDDDSSIDDLSFDYVWDDHGNFVRRSKSSSSSPPTPNVLPTSLKPPSPILLAPPARRSSLSRSESAYPVLNGPSTATSDRDRARSFQRVASGPVSITPAARSPPRRVVADVVPPSDVPQADKENLLDVARPTAPAASAARVLPTRFSTSTRAHLADVPVPQRAHHRQVLPGPSRAARVLKASASAAKYAGAAIGRISEATVEATEEVVSESGEEAHWPAGGEDTDPESALDEPPPNSAPLSAATRQRTYGVSQAGRTRARRSASLSEVSPQHPSPPHRPNKHPSHQNQNQPQTNSRPGTSLGLSGSNSASNNVNDAVSVPARRVAMEERERLEAEMRRKYRREAEEAEGRAKKEVDLQPQPQHHPLPPSPPLPTRKSPSPTHIGTNAGNNANLPRTTAHLRPAYTHKRRDSDTLRSLAPSGSPTAVEDAGPGAKMSGGNVTNGDGLVRHRRSPTAPDPPTTSGMIGGAGAGAGLGKTWAGGDREEGGDGNGGKESGRAAQKEGRGQPAPLQKVQTAPAQQIQASAPLNRQIIVNKKAYARLDLIGKGGSSRVFRVMTHTNELFAIKRVSLDKTDAETMSGYMNEIALLKRLDGNSRIIRLVDSEVKPGPGGSRGHLLLVMECGEIDLARLIGEMHGPLDMVWVAYYWQQMLQAVHVIHEEKIVHSDLKPANFVLVRGQLKLIDFGIANAIANDTTNIQRDHQIGTVNYMSPEAIELPDGMRRLKVGRPSDVWSLGCILYQMVYGQPPFQHLSVYQKMKAIPDMGHVIEFPEYSTPVSKTSSSGGEGGATPPKKLEHLKRRVRRDVIASMKSCLSRNPKERAAIPELLEQDWLAMKEQEPAVPDVKELLAPDETVINPHYMRQLLQYGIKLGESGTKLSPEDLLKEAARLVAELKSVES